MGLKIYPWLMNGLKDTWRQMKIKKKKSYGMQQKQF